MTICNKHSCQIVGTPKWTNVNGKTALAVRPGLIFQDGSYAQYYIRGSTPRPASAAINASITRLVDSRTGGATVLVECVSGCDGQDISVRLHIYKGPCS